MLMRSCFFRHAFCLAACWILLATAGAAAGPRLFFSDLESGPSTGGQDNLGAFLTLWGEGFGSARGPSTVTIGGQEVARYMIWGEDNAFARNLDMIVVQLGGNVRSGDIVVTVDGQTSNPLPFTVREGAIYFVISNAQNANDANPGTFTAPFRSLYRPRQVMQAGDIVYVKGGSFNTIDPANPGWDTILLLDTPDSAPPGTADRPIAYLGYPGESPVLGNPAARRGILLYTSGDAQTYYVFAHLTFTQSSSPLSLSGVGHRAVGNLFHDGAFDDSGTIGVNGESTGFKIFGNLLEQNGEPNNKLHHGFYIGGFGTNRDIEFGWNEINNQRGGRAVQLFGHVAGDWMDNIDIHDNLITGSELNNIVLGGNDDGTEVIGTINIYNNIIAEAGCPGLRVNDPQGTVFIQNNVFYDNGRSPSDDCPPGQVYLERAGTAMITFQNNIVYAQNGQVYYAFEQGGAEPSAFIANHNLCYGAGSCPGWDAVHVNADPALLDVTSGDFRLRAGSPAIDAGIDTGRSRDYMGAVRPGGQAYDIGAIEYAVTAPVGVEEIPASPTRGFRLEQNFPNPFHPETTIRFHLPVPAFVTLTVYNMLGQEVRTLMAAKRWPGAQEVTWDGRDEQGRRVAPGIYAYTLKTQGFQQTRIMVQVL